MLAGGPMRAVQPRPPPRVPPPPPPPARLVRAAAAERADVARHRERLLGARERLRAELAGIEAALRELDERDTLLDRLGGAAPPPPRRARPAARPAGGSAPRRRARGDGGRGRRRRHCRRPDIGRRRGVGG